MKKIWLPAILTIISVFGCSTIDRSQMEYLGEETRNANVSSSVRHIDWYGLGISGYDYISEYDRALYQAFQMAPEGTEKLVNVKTFRETRLWPQILGTGLLSLGPTVVGILAAMGFSSEEILIASVVFTVSNNKRLQCV